MLSAREIAFTVLITPSKATWHTEQIPSWYTARFPVSVGYVRPYQRFTNFLAEYGVQMIDSTALFQANGLTDVFPKTGIHWTKPAAFEASRAVLDVYGQQTGRQTRQFGTRGLLQSSEPTSFGNSEQDIFGIVYAGRRNERENAIVDSLYFWPDVYVADTFLPPITHMTVQGSSFADDIIHYFETLGIAETVARIRYNHDGDGSVWGEIIPYTRFIVLEVNEQHIYNMGGNPPAFGLRDLRNTSRGNNIIDDLFDYLRGTYEF
jgi:hypothetical protein